MTEQLFSGKLPVLAMRGMTVFPDQTTHFDVGRMKSVLALEHAMKADQTILLVPQKNIVDDDPAMDALYPIGTVAKIKQVIKVQHENLRVLVTGICRGRIQEVLRNDTYLEAYVEAVPEVEVSDTVHAKALRREANTLYAMYMEMVEHPTQSIQLRMLSSENSGFIADSIAQNSGIDYPDKAKLLCQLNPVRRLEQAVKLLRQEVEMLRLENTIQEKTKSNIDRNQKDYYLREQMRAIREELGEGDDESEFAEYEKNILKLNLPEESEKKLLKDIARLKRRQY